MKKMLFFILTAAAMALLAQNTESPYGICAHVSRMPEWKNADRELKVIKSGGIDWVRTDFDWKYIQKKPGEWDYSHLDELLKTAKKQKVNILPILCYDVPWVVPVYKNLDRWREYVRRTVSRYAKDLRYWEVWNEANHINGPDYTRLNAEQYTGLLKAAYEEIKKIDPNLQVLYGGTAGVPVPFIERSLKAGASRYFDIMNIHPYAGRTQPESTKTQIDPLFALFAEYNVKKPVWVTEFSWPTHMAVSVAVPVLNIALPKLGLDPKIVTAAVVRNPAMDSYFGKEFPAEDFSVEAFPNRKEIAYSDLKNLDVAKYPVLIPSLTEAFPRKYFNDVADYVRRGGVLVLCCNGFPFYYDAVQDASGKWKRIQKSSAELMKALHIDWLAAWRDGVPAGGKVRLSPGLKGEIRVSGGERYLSAKNLKNGDALIPILIQENGKYSAPVAGIYKLDSDLKGAVIMSVACTSGGVPQTVQGKFLPRACLYFLSAGIEKIFWYKFLAEESSPTEIAWHFGIVHRDLSPRDAFTAYRFLTQMLPAGSSRPVMKDNGNLYSASWKRPDGVKVHAYWAIGAPERVKLPFSVRGAYDYLGRKVTVSGTLTANDGPVYLIAE